MKLSEIAENICRPLENLTGHPVVIAGGAVRDRFWGRKPKDYDIFILEGKLGPPMHNLTIKKARLWGKVVALGVTQDSRFNDFWYHDEGGAGRPVMTFTYCGHKVQVMVRPFKDVPTLLESFDFDICQYAYRYGEVTRPHTTGWAKTGDGKVHGYMKLNREAVKTRFALALRRGIDFSVRYGISFRDADSEWLCAQMAGTGETTVETSIKKSSASSYFAALYPTVGKHMGAQWDVEGTAVPIKQMAKSYLTMKDIFKTAWFDEPNYWGTEKPPVKVTYTGAVDMVQPSVTAGDPQ